MLPSSFHHTLYITLLILCRDVFTGPIQAPLLNPSLLSSNTNVTQELFNDLEELSRIVDISYCVGTTGLGITEPFECASRCSDPGFESFELVTTWNTGALLSDSCGYMVVSHPPAKPRIILAFRGTYSVANTVIDLSTVPQEYIPYPGDEDEDEDEDSSELKKRDINPMKAECTNCTVHAGFMKAWRETRPYILPKLKELVQRYPVYQVTLVGHSLGGAIAALASLDFHSRGWNPHVTTFGEPRIGNQGLMEYVDKAFSNVHDQDTVDMYRRVTHYNDPVPLLPLTEWGYQMHAGEIYISKADLSPEVKDLRHCEGDEDPHCIAGAEKVQLGPSVPVKEQIFDLQKAKAWMVENKGLLEVPPRWRIWQLFFAHRDYFWRLGLCVPGGDPHDWYRKYPNGTERDTDEL